MGGTWGSLVALVIASGAFAGCAAPEDPEALGDGGGPSRPAEIQTSPTLGAIRGRVIDSAISPIENATARLFAAPGHGPELENATTGEDGGFGFSLLEPGTYKVTAEHAAYGTGAVLVQVVVGEAAAVNVMLSEIASAEPYILVQSREGLLKCDWAAVLLSAQCDSFSTVTWFPGTVRSLNLTVPAGHAALVGEGTWADTSSAVESYYYNRAGNTNHRLAIAIGVPVLRKELRPGYGEPGTAVLPRTPVPSSDTPFNLVVQSFYDGRYQREANSTAGPACANVKGWCTGVGVTLDFRFSLYLSAFIHAAPADLARYSALPDQ